MMLFSFKLATLLLMAAFYFFYLDDNLNKVGVEVKFWLRLVISQKQLNPSGRQRDQWASDGLILFIDY